VSLERLFHPRGVAVIGSTARGKLGYALIEQLLAGGFLAVYAVNPKAQGDMSAPGFPRICELPDTVDLAVIASPASTVAGVLEECGLAGIKAAVIITSGFSEAGNAAAEEEIKQIARDHGIRFVGPNCAGIVNTHHKLFPTLETRPPPGVTALVTQSGALGGAVLSWAQEQGLGFSKFASYGNGADLAETDLLEYLACDPETEVVALYIESVRDGYRFRRAVHELTRIKPLVVIKAGRSQAGRRATLSHTGSMAGSDAVYDAVFRQSGAIRVANVEEMFDLCKGFVSLTPIRGRRLAIVTNSGGPGVLAADRAEVIGLKVVEPGADVKEKLARFLPGHGAFGNPIDLTVEGTEDGYRRTLLAMLEGESGYDAALAIDVGTPYLDSLALARGIAAAVDATGKPLVANFMAGETVASSLPFLQEHGIPHFATGERAVTVLGRMISYQEQKEGKRLLPKPAPPAVTLPPSPILEPQAMQWLAAQGIPVPPFRFAEDEFQALQACQEIGYPVVMKVVSPQILHKSESGGVILSICGDEGAHNAYRSIRSRLPAALGVLIVPMIREGKEVLIGISRDPQFGPVVAFGLGGIYTEVWRDLSLRVAPVDLVEAREMICGISAYPILAGVRGEAASDLEALAEAIVTVSQLPFRAPEIEELDCNPVFVLPRGLLVGDVRIIPCQSRNSPDCPTLLSSRQ
jgi:acyl-CoA synthetase (NDP forming)